MGKFIHLLFPQDLPSPLPEDFNWKKEFVTLYTQQYGFLRPETQKLIALIVAGDIDRIQKSNISIEDLKADNLVLIKTATRLNQRDILEYFYSLYQARIESAQAATESAQEKKEMEQEFKLLRWAVLQPRGEVFVSDATCLAAEAGRWDLLFTLLNTPENPVLRNYKLFRELYSSVIRSEQMYMLKRLNNFMVRHQAMTLATPSTARIGGVVKCYLSKAISIAASKGATSIFIKLSHQLHQELIQNEQELNNAIASSARTEKIECLKRSRDIKKFHFTNTLETALVSAVKNGHIPIIKYALEQQFVRINQQLDGRTLLSTAAYYYQPKLVQFLLANQADPKLALDELIRFSSSIRENKPHYEEMKSILQQAIDEREKLSAVVAPTTSTNADNPNLFFDSSEAANPQSTSEQQKQQNHTVTFS